MRPCSALPVIRVEVLPEPEAFFAVIALVLIPLGGWLLAGRQTPNQLKQGDRHRLIVGLAIAVGTVGGIYGIGGGSILVGLGFHGARSRPAALAATFLTSLAGVVTFAALSINGGGNIAPDWVVGIGLGIGGLGGSYFGASFQERVSERALRLALGLLALALGVRCGVLALT